MSNNKIALEITKEIIETTNYKLDSFCRSEHTGTITIDVLVPAIAIHDLSEAHRIVSKIESTFGVSIDIISIKSINVEDKSILVLMSFRQSK